MSDAPKPLNDLLDDWFKTKQELDALETKEQNLRKEVFARFVELHKVQFPDTEIKRGTNKVRIDHGMALIIDHRLNYRIDRAGLEATIQNAGDNEKAVIESIISYSPKVKDAAFEALTTEDKKLVTDFITVSAGLPGIEIKPQNKVRW